MTAIDDRLPPRTQPPADPGAEGPRTSVAAAYRHGAELATQLAVRARATNARPAYVRAERVEHLAAGLTARADAAAAPASGPIVSGLYVTVDVDEADRLRSSGWRYVGSGGWPTAYVLERAELAGQDVPR